MSIATIVQNHEVEKPALIETMLLDRGVELRRISPNSSVFDFYDSDLAVIMGGPSSANDKDERTLALLSAIRGYHKTGEKPMIGICLGAQYISKALGGSVYQSPLKEIGVYKVDIVTRHPAVAGVNSPMDVFQWHGEAFTVPKGGVLLAASTHNGQAIAQAFRIGHLHAYQLHPEMRLKDVLDMTYEFPEDIFSMGKTPQQVVSEYLAKAWEIQKQGATLLNNVFDQYGIGRRPRER